MFEEFENEEKGEKEERNKLLKMTAYILGAILIVGAVVYIASRGHAKTAQPAQTPGAARQTAPDAVRDLKLVKAVMGKDPSGIRVMWSVQLRNRSAVYTYSDIKYEARFIGPDGRTLSANQDTIKTSLAPGEEKKIPDFLDGTFNADASTYQFLIVSATSAVE